MRESKETPGYSAKFSYSNSYNSPKSSLSSKVLRVAPKAPQQQQQHKNFYNHCNNLNTVNNLGAANHINTIQEDKDHKKEQQRHQEQYLYQDKYEEYDWIDNGCFDSCDAIAISKEDLVKAAALKVSHGDLLKAVSNYHYYHQTYDKYFKGNENNGSPKIWIGNVTKEVPIDRLKYALTAQFGFLLHFIKPCDKPYILAKFIDLRSYEKAVMAGEVRVFGKPLPVEPYIYKSSAGYQ
ncbi:10443_t:CDS:2 [Ambispora gerdemannii]|uniref:10443_t:CDS:1 n=1 Tax=Ambispora gerdemannii TaxID=144530 RepID=A0A9N9CB92_9GLOM|nr:10443_t:CDS:2 [Ambispora gerdemannii]